MALDPLAIDDHLAHMKRDAEAYGLLARDPDRGVAELALDLLGEAQRVHDALEDGENAVAGDVDDPPAIVEHERAEEPDRTRHTREGLVLVRRHQPREARHVGEQDRRQLPPGR